MNKATTLLTALVLFFVASDVSAQSPRRGRSSRPAAAKPATAQPTPQATPTPTPAPTETPVARVAPILLATVNGQNITTADLDPPAREEAETLDGRIAQARKQVLELEINSLLLDVEARKRKMTPQQLYEAEVVKKIVEPTPAEITKFIEENRNQIEQSDKDATRKIIAAYLKGERENALSSDFVKRLRASQGVVKGVDINAPNLSSSSVVATVAGQPMTAGNLIERLKPIIYQLRHNAYHVQKPGLDMAIDVSLLLAESKAKNILSEEIVRKEITERKKPPTDTEIAKFYEDNKSALKAELSTIKNQIAAYLQDQDRLRLEQELSNRLRKGANIRVLLSEPEVPVLSISVDDDPSRGDANAAVTIVEFTDFQCPACAAMNPVFEEVMKPYGNKVRLVIRDFPLAIHPNALKAAEAANAAHAQGKFFEYAALLFKRQDALDTASLKKYASELGLDRARFDAALDSGKYSAEVKHDMEEGQTYGIGSTPTIFVNGKLLKVLSSESLKAAIDQALSQTKAR